MSAYADRVRWYPHRIDMTRAIIGAQLTPLHDVVAPTLERLPVDIGAQLRRDFWRRHDATADWSGKYEAQEWLAEEVAAFERQKVHRAFDEHEIRALASRWSDLCRRMVRLEPMQEFAQSVGIEPPEIKRNVTRVGAAGRLSCPRWWRRQIRKAYLRQAEAHLRAVGFVHKKRQVYASDRAVEHRRQRKARDRAMLQEMQVVSDAGDQLELWEVVQKSQANPALRRAELMTRLRGFEEVAQAAGHVAEFATLTCPSAFHRTHANGTKNERWEGFAPRQGQQWLCKMWARARAKLARLSVAFYGFRVAEPHHDGTPHWHLVLFVKETLAETLRTVLGGIWLKEYGHEPGAMKVRATFKRIDPAKGSACGYLAKYIAKNIDGFEVGDDHETNGQKATESCDRVGAWASAHGIRQFQQIGGPPVTVWRELRRLRDAGVHPAIREAHAAADAGQWADFIAAVGGIEAGRRCAVGLWTETTGELNQYDELRGPQIAGVQTVLSGHRAENSIRAQPNIAAKAWKYTGCTGPLSAFSIVRVQAYENVLVQLPRDSSLPDAQGEVPRGAASGASGDAGEVPRMARNKLARVRTREKVWRIQRKAPGAVMNEMPRPDRGHARACVPAPAPVSSLGPVSITVRGSKTMPAEERTGASIRGSPWMH